MENSLSTVVERLTAEGLLTRNSGSNSLKSIKEVNTRSNVIHQEGGVYFDSTKPDFQPSFGHETSWNLTVLPFVCMVFNSYIMHYNTPRFYMELKDRSIARFTLAVSWSFGLAAIILILIAGAGYLTFGQPTFAQYAANFADLTCSPLGLEFDPQHFVHSPQSASLQ